MPSVTTGSDMHGGTTTGTEPGADASAGNDATPGADGQTMPVAVNPWNLDVTSLAVHARSDAMRTFLKSKGGFGGGNHKLQIDPTLAVVRVPESTPLVPYARNGNYATPDCDDLPFPRPTLPTWTSCSGDCDVIVLMGNKEFDLFGAESTIPLKAGCLAVWDVAKVYPPTLRGDQCTSADAAGFPKAAMAINPDEIASGVINHALRLVFPNDRFRKRKMVRPATHAGVTAEMSDSEDAIPYGTRFRLKSGFDLTKLPSDGGRVIARAFQKYGLIIADGGEIPVTAWDDTYTTAKWDTVVKDGSHELFAITLDDLEILEAGPLLDVTFECVRNP